MTTRIWRWAGVSLVIAAAGLACSGGGSGGIDDGGQPDAFAQDANSGDGTLLDGAETSLEDAAEAGKGPDAREDATASMDAADGGEVGDASSDADADVGGDAAEAGDTDAGNTDASDDTGADASDDWGDSASDAQADASGDAGIIFVIVSCQQMNAGAYSSTWIDSAGNRYYQPGPNPPPSAGTRAGPFPPPTSKFSEADLVELLTAAQTLDISSAGYTTTIGPPVHNNARQGTYYSAGTMRYPPTLVDFYEDGISVGHKKVISANDPAANVIRKYECFVID